MPFPSPSWGEAYGRCRKDGSYSAPEDYVGMEHGYLCGPNAYGLQNSDGSGFGVMHAYGDARADGSKHEPS